VARVWALVRPLRALANVVMAEALLV
jgi:hypothetical protein